MCQFCHQHGDGKKWYLRAEHYAAELMDHQRRRDVVRDIFGHPDRLARQVRELDLLDHAPGFVQRAVKGSVSRRMMRDHFGQVLPIEDVAEVFGFVNSIVRVPCICRYATLRREMGYCYGVTLTGAEGKFVEALRDVGVPALFGPDTSGFDTLTAEEALAALVGHEQEGLCHTVWTFVTPFIGGICNCNRGDCLAMRSTVDHGLKVMWRAEYVAEVDRDACSGCRACLGMCQFGAMGYSAADRKAAVDPRACYGCGVCRAACTQDAIRLRAREEVPAAAGIW